MTIDYMYFCVFFTRFLRVGTVLSVMRYRTTRPYVRVRCVRRAKMERAAAVEEVKREKIAQKKMAEKN